MNRYEMIQLAQSLNVPVDRPTLDTPACPKCRLVSPVKHVGWNLENGHRFKVFQCRCCAYFFHVPHDY